MRLTCWMALMFAGFLAIDSRHVQVCAQSPGEVPLLSTPHIPYPIIGGRRATARIMPNGLGLTDISQAPCEGFARVELQPAAHPGQVDVLPNRVIHHIVDFDGRPFSITFFAAVEEPFTAMLVEPEPPGEASPDSAPLEISFLLKPNVDYLHKFVGTGEQTFKNESWGLRFATTDHPELTALFKTNAALTMDLPVDGKVIPGQPLLLKALFSSKGGFVILASTSVAKESDPTLDALLTLDMEGVCTASRTALEADRQTLGSGARLQTPDPALDEFFLASRIWFHKMTRRLPFGEPWSLNARENTSVDVLTASPIYHGVFANDNLQTALEGMLVAPGLKDVFRNDLELALNYARHWDGNIPESVEYIFGNQELFMARLPIGQHPQWIVSLASVALLSGDRQMAEDLWPGVELALDHFIDANGDGIGEWDTSAYPEHPITTGYEGGMLYAQAWWVWAFEQASELARWLGRNEEAETLLARSVAARQAMERVFGREDGYGAWLSPEGQLAPYVSHCAILPLALGQSPAERAARVIETMQAPPMWMPGYGPHHMSDASLRGGRLVWGFMRWNFIQALFENGRVDEGATLAGEWARQELAQGIVAPEVLPDGLMCDRFSQGYVWTAGRAVRALSFGLFGLRPRAEGLEVNPHLPTDWDSMALTDIPYRGRTIDIRVARGPARSAMLNGQPWEPPLIRERDLNEGGNTLLIVLP